MLEVLWWLAQAVGLAWSLGLTLVLFLTRKALRQSNRQSRRHG